MFARTSSSSVCQVDAGQAGELTQLHVEDVVRLHLAELVRRGHQAASRAAATSSLARMRAMICVDDVERLDAALEDVLAALGLVEPELRPPGDDLDAGA